MLARLPWKYSASMRMALANVNEPGAEAIHVWEFGALSA
jgi:hypothetical protein